MSQQEELKEGNLKTNPTVEPANPTEDPATGENDPAKADPVAGGSETDFDAWANPKDPWPNFDKIGAWSGPIPPESETKVIEEWAETAATSSIVIIHGPSFSSLQYVAEAFARRWHPRSDLRVWKGTEALGDDFGILREDGPLLWETDERRCLVLGISGHSSCEHFIEKAHYLTDAANLIAEIPLKIVFFVARPLTKNFKLPARSSKFPFNYLDPDLQARNATHSLASYENLLVNSFIDPSDTLNFQKLLIQQTLVRLAVLFGGALIPEIDSLMKQALSQKGEITGFGGDRGDGKPNTTLYGLWGANRSWFADLTGVTIRPANSQFGNTAFVTPESEEYATRAAWHDPYEMAGIFMAIDGADIFFSTSKNAEDYAAAYIGAANSFTGQAGSPINSNWLLALVSRYLGINESASPDLESPADGSVIRLLKQINKKNKRDQQVRRLLVSRVGSLLKASPVSLLNSVMDHLLDNDLQHLAWAILINEIIDNPASFIPWVEKIINSVSSLPDESDAQLLGSILLDCIYTAVWSDAGSRTIHSAFKPWLPQASKIAENARATLAGDMPHRMIKIIDKASPAKADRMMTRITSQLTQGDEADIVRGYWLKALSHPSSARNPESKSPGHDGYWLGVSLFRFTRCASPRHRDDLTAFLSDLQQRIDDYDTNLALHQFWDLLKSRLATELFELPYGEDTEKKRAALENELASCDLLTSIF